MAYMSRDSRFYITNPNTLTTVYANDGRSPDQKPVSVDSNDNGGICKDCGCDD